MKHFFLMIVALCAMETIVALPTLGPLIVNKTPKPEHSISSLPDIVRLVIPAKPETSAQIAQTRAAEEEVARYCEMFAIPPLIRRNRHTSVNQTKTWADVTRQ